MNRYLEKALKTMEEATRGMSAEELERAPVGKWSSAQIVEHLSRAFGSTHRALQKQVKDGAAGVTSATLKQRTAVWVVVHLGLFPSGRKAPEFTVPTGIGGDEALRQFRENLSLMDDSIRECARRKKGRYLAVHPILGPMTVYEWYKFHWVHTRHHAKQIVERRKAGER